MIVDEYTVDSRLEAQTCIAATGKLPRGGLRKRLRLLGRTLWFAATGLHGHDPGHRLRYRVRQTELAGADQSVHRHRILLASKKSRQARICTPPSLHQDVQGEAGISNAALLS